MSESTIKLLNNPYGQASFDSFRHKNMAFADKSLIIKYFDDRNLQQYTTKKREENFCSTSLFSKLGAGQPEQSHECQREVSNYTSNEYSC